MDGWTAFIDPRDHQRYKRPAGEAREGRNGQQRTGKARQGKVEESPMYVPSQQQAGRLRTWMNMDEDEIHREKMS
jgi:hypothetical protein